MLPDAGGIGMILERNTRIICRPLQDGGMLYDPDRRDGMILNASGVKIYAALGEFTETEKIYRTFSGVAGQAELEKFLAMLQKHGYISGFDSDIAVGTPKRGVVEGQYGVGFSMSGTFYPGDRLESKPVKSTDVCRGDVICFKSAAGNLTAHRIIGGRPGAWVTMGDNNFARDKEIVIQEDLQLVTAISRGGVRHPVAGGKAGMRHFHIWRGKYFFRKWLKKIIAIPARLVISCCFWRREPEQTTDFGRLLQYSSCGRVIGWKIGSSKVFSAHKFRFLYRLPEEK